jgi:hypothetical protein
MMDFSIYILLDGVLSHLNLSTWQNIRNVVFCNYRHTDMLIVLIIVKITKKLTKQCNILVLSGVEFTYIPQKFIKSVVIERRKLGSEVVIVH